MRHKIFLIPTHISPFPYKITNNALSYNQIIIPLLYFNLEYNNQIMLSAQVNQQNKQGEQIKKVSYNKFLSIKSIIRNKKIIVKKSVPSRTLYGIFNNTCSTSDLANGKDKGASARGYSSHCVTQHNSNPNVVNIKFGDDDLKIQKTHDQKIRKRIISSIFSQEQRKTIQSVKEKDKGFVEDTLVIEPFLKKQTEQVDWSKMKGLHHYVLLDKRNRKTENIPACSKNRESEMKQAGKHVFHYRSKSKMRSGRKTAVNFYQKEELLENVSKDTFRELNRKQSETNVAHKQQQKQDKQEKRKEDFKEFLPLRKPTGRKDYFVFGMSEKPANEPENKIELYRDFIWKINYSNGLFVHTPENIDQSYKVFFGRGNNSCMLKSIMRRRFWWTIVDENSSASLESCHFVWTQLKVNSLFKLQLSHGSPELMENDPEERSEERNEERNEHKRVKQCISQDETEQLAIAHARIFNYKDCKNWQNHMMKNGKIEQKISEQTYVKRLNLYTKKSITKVLQSNKLRIHNHLESNFYIGNKKALFYNMRRICQCKGENPFKYIPLTFHIAKGVDDPVYDQFLKHYQEIDEQRKTDKNFRNIWIAKPGQNSNRGNGISVCFGLDDIRHRLRGKQKNSDGNFRTFIIQKYIEKPFLYKYRKFDIRHYMLITCFNGQFKGYWYDEGYIRTSSSTFHLKNTKDILVHLTNDAVQKKSETYGKHEKGNKISYEDFQKYLDTSHKKKKLNFLSKTLKRMKQIAKLSLEATYSLLDPSRRENNFELIGLDFMIDQNFDPWLIEANTNPCLELSCPLLEKLIPGMIEQTFRICVDPFFPPPQNWTNKKQFFGENALLENRFELIFDEVTDGKMVQDILMKQGSKEQQQRFNQAIGKIEEDNEIFEDDGNDQWENKDTN